ncbi:MAG: efflux RND transporter periplasmic adaptor subunit [Gammaproteobacteria bacterium]
MLCVAMHPAGAADPVTVSARPLSELAIDVQLDAPATAVSLREARAGTQIGGLILDIPVKVGDAVSQGAPLAHLDCRDHENAATQLQAVLRGLAADRRLARLQLTRGQKLIKDSSASEELVDQRRAEVLRVDAQIAQKEAELSLARINIERCTLNAPFDGIVTERLSSEGEVVSAGTPVIRLLDINGVELTAEVPLSLVPSLAGNPSDIHFEVLGDAYVVHCRLMPRVDARARARESRCTFPGDSPLPGTPGRLVWTDPRPHVPAWLLVQRDKRAGLFIVEDGQARFHAPQGAIEGRPAAIFLGPDTRIVTEGRHGLSDGTAVSVVTATAGTTD